MKRLIMFIIFIVTIIIFYFMFTTSVREYKLEYKKNGFNIVEEYDKEKNIYIFNVSNNFLEFNFIYNKDYSNKRELVKNVDIKFVNDKHLCVKPIVDDMVFNYICHDGSYKDEYLVGLTKKEENKLYKSINNIDIYDKDYDYYVWNGYGFTDVLSNKEYNFLKKEKYDNPISFKTDEYIIVADYDQVRDFNKFYLFYYKEKKVEEFKLKIDIDHDSYFIGEVDDLLYLYDKKNNKQYKINIKKKKVNVSSGKEFGAYYDGEWKKKSLNEFKYYMITMDDNDLYDYKLEDSKLYLVINGSDNKILVSDKEIDSILYINKDEVFYFIDDTIYSYKFGRGEEKIVQSFEWKFSSKNKIFIFN